MNLTAIATLVLALAQSDTSALVEASKEAKEKRKGSTTRVITNADVKKAKSKVAERPGVPVTIKPKPSLVEQHETDRKARIAREEQLKVVNETIAALKKELAAIEQSYYEANDLNYRDTELVKRFNDVKAKLDEARAQLPKQTVDSRQ
jgi:hypothetical protein